MNLRCSGSSPRLGAATLALAASLASAQCQPNDIFPSRTTLSAGFPTSLLAFGDIDDDGLGDMMLYSGLLNQTQWILYGSFIPLEVICASCPAVDMIATDLNADGIGDLVALSDTGFRYYYGNGSADGAFDESGWVDIVGASKAAAGDTNSDGRTDLAFLNTDNGTIYVRHQDASGQFPNNDQTFAIGGLVSDLEFADINGDGRDDLLVLFTGFDWLMVYVQDGSGQLGSEQHYTIGSSVYARDIAVGDVDGDGDLDVVAACLNTDTVTVMTNNGDGAFTPSGSFATLTNPSQVTLTDLNHDGMADIGVIGDTTAAVEIRVATGGGAFGPATHLATDSPPLSITFGNLNGDTADDLIAHCGQTANFHLFNNACLLPDILTQPAPLTVIDAGDAATLSVATSSNFARTYQWMKNGVDIANDDHFSGATTNQLTIHHATAAHSDTYTVRVTSLAGTTTSDQAAVLVRQSCVPDINGDGNVNTLDVIAFLNAWVSGC